MNRPLEEYFKHADELAQVVLNAWGSNWHAGNRSFTPEFNALLDKTCRYRTAKSVADNRRECNILTEQELAEECDSRLAFAQAYKVFHERHEHN